MSLDEIRERYDRLSQAFAAKIDAVPADKWDAPSPCEGWTARDVVKHVAETPSMIFQMAEPVGRLEGFTKTLTVKAARSCAVEVGPST